VSGSGEYKSEKRLKIKEALGPKKPSETTDSHGQERNVDDLK
jgi:hypothetical protein